MKHKNNLFLALRWIHPRSLRRRLRSSHANFSLSQTFIWIQTVCVSAEKFRLKIWDVRGAERVNSYRTVCYKFNLSTKLSRNDRTLATMPANSTYPQLTLPVNDLCVHPRVFVPPKQQISLVSRKRVKKNKAKQAKQNWNNNKKKIHRKIEDWKTNCRADYNIVGLLKSNELVARENTNTNPHGIEQN